MTNDPHSHAMPIRTPIIWFGCKRRQAPCVWQLLGKVDSYLEPFAGSCAVMLGNPWIPNKEVINDIDAFITNFWRSVQHDPQMVLRCASKISNDIENVARKKYLAQRYADLKEKCTEDLAYFDSEIAGMFLYCNANSLNPSLPKEATNTRLFVAPGTGRGWQMTRKRLDPYESFDDWMNVLAYRFQRVAVLCRDWRDIRDAEYLLYFNYAKTKKHRAGVYLDPPYTRDARKSGRGVYAQEDYDVANDCRQWAFEKGDDPALRIVLSGYETEFGDMPEGWTTYRVPRKAGHENFSKDKTKKKRPVEILAASPHCLSAAGQTGLFSKQERLK